MPLLSDSVRQLAAALIVAALLITGLIIGKTVLIPLAGAAIISFILAPVVRRMTAIGFPRSLSVTAIVAVVLFLFISAATLLSVEMLSITSRIDAYRENLIEKVRTVASIGKKDGALKRAAQTIDRLTETIGNELRTPVPQGTASSGVPVVVNPKNGDTGASAFANLSLVAEPATRFALLVLFTVFLLLQHQDMRDRIVRIVGADNLSETTSAMSEAGKRLSRLFLAQTIMSASYGLVIGTVLWVVGLPGAIVWGVLSGLMRFVPFIGTYIAAIPPIVLAASVDPGWWLAIFTATFFIVSELVMGNVIEPLVLGRRVGLSPFAMIAAASFWTLVWGPVGLLLAAPLTMALVVLGRYVHGLSFVTVLLGDEPALEPSQELYHRLLSSDALAAAEQIEDSIDETSLARTADQLVLPALTLAANDARARRLTDQQFETITETLAEATELNDQLETPAERDDNDAAVLVIPARGNIDIMGARFLARIIEADTLLPSRAMTHATGLTALSLGSAPDGEASPHSIVIASISGLPNRQLQLMAARAERAFQGAKIIVFSAMLADSEQSHPSSRQSAARKEATFQGRSVATVLELIGNLKIDAPNPTEDRIGDPKATSADHRTVSTS